MNIVTYFYWDWERVCLLAFPWFCGFASWACLLDPCAAWPTQFENCCHFVRWVVFCFADRWLAIGGRWRWTRETWSKCWLLPFSVRLVRPCAFHKRCSTRIKSGTPGSSFGSRLSLEPAIVLVPHSRSLSTESAHRSTTI